MIEILIELIADYFLLLERIEPNVMDPDDAVRLLEDFADGLQQLTPPDRKEFIKCLERVAAKRPQQARAALLRLPEAVGIG